MRLALPDIGILALMHDAEDNRPDIFYPKLIGACRNALPAELKKTCDCMADLAINRSSKGKLLWKDVHIFMNLLDAIVDPGAIDDDLCTKMTTLSGGIVSKSHIDGEYFDSLFFKWQDSKEKLLELMNNPAIFNGSLFECHKKFKNSSLFGAYPPNTAEMVPDERRGFIWGYARKGDRNETLLFGIFAYMLIDKIVQFKDKLRAKTLISDIHAVVRKKDGARVNFNAFFEKKMRAIDG